jgi:hypothetical protein
MRNFVLFISFLLLLFSCNLPELKKLNSESKKEVQSIVKELKLEQFEYSYHSKYNHGKSRNFFSVKLWNIDDSTDFKAYNDRVIQVFEKSNYELKNQDFIRISYFKNYIPVNLFVYYEIDPRTKEIINEGTR